MSAVGQGEMNAVCQEVVSAVGQGETSDDCLGEVSAVGQGEESTVGHDIYGKT